MKNFFDPFYRKWNIHQIDNLEDWYRDLKDQFALDCNPEDLKYNKEAKKCFNMIKRKKTQIKYIVRKEGKLLTE